MAGIADSQSAFSEGVSSCGGPQHEPSVTVVGLVHVKKNNPDQPILNLMWALVWPFGHVASFNRNKSDPNNLNVTFKEGAKQEGKLHNSSGPKQFFWGARATFKG